MKNNHLNPTTMKTLSTKIEKMKAAISAAIEAEKNKEQFYAALNQRNESIDLGERGVCEYVVYDGLDEYLEASKLQKAALRKARRAVESVAGEFGLTIKETYNLSYLRNLQQVACRLILRFDEILEIARRVESYDSCFALAE